ncbi:MAG: VPLPA-CTERM sorting domain-containing protein [Pseudomonadota bacterium]
MIRNFLGAAALSILGATQTVAATLNFTLTEVGSNVVSTAVGSVDLTGYVFLVPASLSSVRLSSGDMQIGAGNGSGATGLVDFYQAVFSGPDASFGTRASSTKASFGTGDVTNILVDRAVVEVPAGYVSGDAINSTATWVNRSFASLGITPGTYTTVAGNTTFNLDIGGPAPVPLPAALPLLLAGLGGLGFVARLRRGAALG